MAVNSSGEISLQSLQDEFGGVNPISLAEYYRGGSLVPSAPAANANIPLSGQISLSNFYSSISAFVFNHTISSTTTNFNIREAAIAAGWNQTVPLLATVTVANGIVVGSTSNGEFSFETGDGYPDGSDIIVINNGYIVGYGGQGGSGGNYGWSSSGANGGPAMLVSTSAKFYNYGIIGGGGGGGGGVGNRDMGAGGSGGAGYTPGAAGVIISAAAHNNTNGNPGTLTAGGAAATTEYAWQIATGGAGGNLGQAGGTGYCNVDTTSYGAGGAAGNAINGYYMGTWYVVGTIYGYIETSGGPLPS